MLCLYTFIWVRKEETQEEKQEIGMASDKVVAVLLVISSMMVIFTSADEDIEDNDAIQVTQSSSSNGFDVGKKAPSYVDCYARCFGECSSRSGFGASLGLSSGYCDHVCSGECSPNK
ncbi:hypothetical protein L6164_018434 [Bauhinia variegata]|uniref:Uncharacterized protein n=1 Tax=Bauhinia variegata TaxID=167791 RepID=A0ACB9NCY2_BAUVA|nr:hypothetical protein L6164_018434 [Bauhinia variegata]